MSKFGKRRESFRALGMAFLSTALMALAVGNSAYAAGNRQTVQGSVQSNGNGLGNYQVSMYAGLPNGRWKLLGQDNTNPAGHFTIKYSSPQTQAGKPRPPVFIEAVSGPVMLASAIGNVGKVPKQVVINERTTVATGNAFAQFITGDGIFGNPQGMSNAPSMAANLADPQSGEVGVVLGSVPNRDETTTLATFNSLTNVVASCVAVADNCAKLFAAATPPGGTAPTNVLQALANIVKNPSYLELDGSQAADDPLFDLSQQTQIYTPFLAARPTNWLLFLKLTGGFYSVQNEDNLLNGPANFAIDKQGSVWIANNYIPEPQGQTACAGNRMARFTPSGAVYPKSPYMGGGVSGAGYGITFDPNNKLWMANFGFQDPPCADTPEAAPSDSITKFNIRGKALSPSTGFAVGDISWPQGVVSDLKGNLFVANCGNDSITEIFKGNPKRTINIKLADASTTPNVPNVKPFGIALDLNGDAWVTDNFNNTMSIVSPEGKLLATLGNPASGPQVLTHPIGNIADSKGNIWVANSDWLDAPCPDTNNVGMGMSPSITMYAANTRVPYQNSPFTGGGLTVPWGIAVDGNDSVWVFNFGSIPVDPVACAQTGLNQFKCAPTGISHFCGANVTACPAGLRRVGAPISPSLTGYQSNALERITGGQIDPSGNIWIAGNWKINATPDTNPGGNSIAIAVGAAAPLRTPLIGPPVPF